MSSVEFTYVQPNGTDKTVRVEDAGSVMEAALRQGVEGILGTCGGNMSCGTCHVQLSAELFAKIGGPEADEEDMLGSLDDRTATSRLSCQIRVDGDLRGARFRVMGSGS